MERRVQIDPSEVPRIVVRLAAARPRPSIAWLDGDGLSALGRYSHVAVGTTRALMRWPDVVAALCAPRRATIALAYDLAWTMPIGIRRAPALPRGPDAPVAWILEHDATLVLDHETHEATIAGDVDAIASALSGPTPTPRASISAIAAEPRDVHRAAIARALDDIGRGDVYQVNLARRFHAAFTGDPLALALAMREASPVPLGVHLEGPPGSGEALVSRTMERFLHFDASTRTIETRPIKGTRPRAHGEDDAARRALLSDEKERAEHAMIVDLMRNDLSRVAEPGSVIVREAMRVEPYARLSHLVSVVEARVAAEHDLGAILQATFPPGSVTGAPKLAAIERIEAYERFARGFYTGAIGHVAGDGSLSLAVAIRTAQLARGELVYLAGGGIVEASDPDREVDETELKARVLVDAAAILASHATLP